MEAGSPIPFFFAGVAELADAPDLGSGVPDVQVQVLSPAPDRAVFGLLFFLFLFHKNRKQLLAVFGLFFFILQAKRLPESSPVSFDLFCCPTAFLAAAQFIPLAATANGLPQAFGQNPLLHLCGKRPKGKHRSLLQATDLQHTFVVAKGIHRGTFAPIQVWAGSANHIAAAV